MIHIKEFDKDLFLKLCKQYGVKLDKVINSPVIVLDNGKEKPLNQLNKKEIENIILNKTNLKDDIMQKYCGYCKNYIFQKCFKFNKEIGKDTLACEQFSPCVEYQITLLQEKRSDNGE